MVGIAYSYLRFSTPEQAFGDSRRRQAALAEDYARRHNLMLDKGLNFRDIGISAFRGKNAKEGGLRSFLDAVEYGLVPANSFLLIESLDRLSRDQILEAQSLFLQIINAGVTIVTLLDQRSYSVASLNMNPTDLIISLVYMMRANEESETKSFRLKAAWAARRDRPGNTYHGGQCPGWIRPNLSKTGYELIPERVKVLQRIFRQSIEGAGLQTIARQLNEEGVPLFGRGNQRGKLWQRALLRHMLQTDLVIGTYTPCKAEIVCGKTRYVPIGPKPFYYPAAISLQDWLLVRERRLAWSAYYGCQRRNAKVANVLSRLGRCPRCDRPMVLQRTEVRNQRYLVCMAWREARICSNEWVRFPEIEDALVADVRFVIGRCPQPALHVETRRAMLRAIASRLSHLRQRGVRELAAREVLDATSRPGRDWELGTKLEMDELLAERYRLRADRSYWEDATLKLKLEKLNAAVAAVPRDLARINAAYRSLLIKVVVDWPKAQLALHWRHGGQSIVPFWRQRQKGTERNASSLGLMRRHAMILPPVKRDEVTAALTSDPAHVPCKYIALGGLTGTVLASLEACGRSMGARELTSLIASDSGILVGPGPEMDSLMARVRKALSRSKVYLVREGRPGTYKWTLRSPSCE